MKLVVYVEAIIEYQNTNKMEANELHLVEKGQMCLKIKVKGESLGENCSRSYPLDSLRTVEIPLLYFNVIGESCISRGTIGNVW